MAGAMQTPEPPQATVGILRFPEAFAVAAIDGVTNLGYAFSVVLPRGPAQHYYVGPDITDVAALAELLLTFGEGEVGEEKFAKLVQEAREGANGGNMAGGNGNRIPGQGREGARPTDDRLPDPPDEGNP